MSKMTSLFFQEIQAKKRSKQQSKERWKVAGALVSPNDILLLHKAVQISQLKQVKTQ